jgi:AraC-like DNA-binding protein
MPAHPWRGDRCVSFRYATDFFASIAGDVGARDATSPFRLLRLPPLRVLSPLVGLSCAGLVGSMSWSWEELSVQVAARAAEIAGGISRRVSDPTPDIVGRVARVVRAIECHPGGRLTLDRLARSADLSPYHFLRTFERVTGVTPHQYVLRARLREAATRLTADPSKVLDVALDCGFGDVSNFNRAFRAEFGDAPRRFRTGARRGRG